MANRYFKLYTDTPFMGTDETELIVTDGSDFEVDYDEVAYMLFDDYGYPIHGWGGKDPTEDEEEDFISNCIVDFEEISEEEFNRLTEFGYNVVDMR